MTDGNVRYKLFPYLYIKRVREDFILFNPLSFSVVILPSKKQYLLREFEKPRGVDRIDKDLAKLLDAKILVEEKYDYEKQINNIFNGVMHSNSFISSWYVLVAENCNLNCPYCFIEKSYTSDHSRQSIMHPKIAERAAEYIVEHSSTSNNIVPQINFFGGEPLLNFSAIKTITQKLSEIENQGQFNHNKLGKSIVTNGTLISQEHADFFYANDFNVAISIDGPEKIHNKMRIYKDGRGSFSDTLRGYNLVKETGKTPAISCTVGYHNVNILPNIAEYFVQTLDAEEVTFNIMRGCNRHSSPMQKKPLIDLTTDAILKAFEILKEYGVRENTVYRILSPLIEGKRRIHYCSGNGHQIVITANGRIGPCPSYLDSKKYFFGNIFESGDPTNSYTIKRWKSRTPFHMPQCFGCPCISICGGGCAYEGEINTNSLMGTDINYCTFCQKILDYFLEKMYWHAIGK